MLSFESDYIAGAHPAVLQKLVETNLEVMPGYGIDPYCVSAVEKIKAACGTPDAGVFFLVGGTQTNQVVISSLLQEYEGVVAADTGHISAHEVGAIEYTGHKVLTIPGANGKLAAADLQKYLAAHYADENHEHMVFPGMVYISFPTEWGTIYSKKELQDLYTVCSGYRLPLFIDGARLGYGLASYENDLTLEEIASYCDVFYIGGTKVGALCGEAVVYTKRNTPRYFVSRMKQHGALLAKGRLLGVQFDTLFTDDLYMRISRHAIDMAEKMKEIFRSKGYAFYMDSPTNQQFVILENNRMKKLAENVAFCYWCPVDADHTAVRFATSWSTTEEDLEKLEAIL